MVTGALAVALSMGALAIGCSSQPATTCDDAAQNGDETDIDCGGACGSCADGMRCDAPGDCLSQVCESGACVPPRCGDGVVQDGEACDDGAPSATCNANCMPARCGDGTVDPGEDCDEGGADTATCDADCTAALCGDGYNNASVEACDDGNADNTDACLDMCAAASCGDGHVFVGMEECDEGGADTATCDADCTAALCGDGYNNASVEACDDGNADNTDACLDTCVAASCGDGYLFQGMEECDDGNAVDSDDCTSVCELADCTDRITNADEIDVDCGGHCGLASCRPRQTCTDSSDCVSNQCVNSRCLGASLVTGNSHTCTLTTTGTVRCWGHNTVGQLGLGHVNDIGDDELPSTEPDVDVGGTVVQLTAGGLHTCALLDTGKVRCWGANGQGRLGYGHTNKIGDDESPSSAGDVDVGGTVTQIAAGGSHTCALLDTGAVRCWGYNDYGQLGYGHTSAIGDDESPSAAGDVDVGGPVVEITAGNHHTCALLVGGAVRCWGIGAQLGYGHTSTIGDNELPSSAGDVPIGGTVTRIQAGVNHTCVLLSTGAVRCWGYNYYGQLGYGHTSTIGDDEPPSSAGDIMLGGTAVQVMAAYYHTCALLSTGAMRCWGYNSFGELGYGHENNIGDDEHPFTAGDVGVGSTVMQIGEGLGLYTCALLSTGATRCWGYNNYGQLGYGHINRIGDDELPSAAGDVPYQ